MDPDGTVRLVGAILRDTPSLPGAACRGRHELYDEIPGQSCEARAQRCELAADPDLVGHPLLARLTTDLLDEERAQFLDKV